MTPEDQAALDRLYQFLRDWATSMPPTSGADFWASEEGWILELEVPTPAKQFNQGDCTTPSAPSNS